MLLSSLRHYWRTHLGVILGSALATAVLTGALFVGDSVKATLKAQALLRVGDIQSAIVGGDRFFRAQLADETDAAPVLLLPASVVRPDQKARANAVQLIGMDDRFFDLTGQHHRAFIAGVGFGLNEGLARQLDAKVGDTLLIRVEKPGLFSRDAPLSGEQSEVLALRLTVTTILDDTTFGRFSLHASQVPPLTAFIDLRTLQEKLGLPGKANLLLSRSPNLRTRVAEQWTLDDAALQLLHAPAGELELRSSRVFLDPPAAKAAPRGSDSLTYLVNELRAGDKAAPYSMATGIDAPSSGFLPAELADDEIAISQWLAEDLGITTGASVTMKYYVMGERRELREEARTFTVLHVIPQTDPNLNKSWMPPFPGVDDKLTLNDWEPGFAMDMTKLRPQDDDYWTQYQGTPKAFVNINIGQRMWGNRWGDLTAIRYPIGTTQASVAQKLREVLTPETIGLTYLPLREQALAATDAPVDFGQLFTGFSIFLVAAAAVLTGLLFVFSLRQRTAEVGLLLALGWPAARVRRQLLLEGAVLAAIGAAIGVGAAVLYTFAALRALSTVWRGAVGAMEFLFAPSPASIAIGLASGISVAMLSMWLAARKPLRQTAQSLLAGEPGDATVAKSATPSKPRRAALVLATLLLAAGSLLFAVKAGASPGLFFAGGAFILLLCLFNLRNLLGGIDDPSTPVASIANLGLRNMARRRGRSLATIAVLASGVFMVVAVDSFRKQGDSNPGDPRSGTGGYELIAESTLPIYEDPNTAQGREAIGLDAKAMQGVAIVPMRLREGDDASCLNLNRALQPRLLGVRPTDLTGRFTGADWSLLERNQAFPTPAITGAIPTIPGIVDSNTLQWALQKKLGETLDYLDERGLRFRVQLVAAVSGSILQGSVVISEAAFLQRYPSAGGYRVFLVDAPPERTAEVGATLSRALTDRGLSAQPAARRLAEFQAVENTYLAIFQALGGLGLLLGSAGLAIVVARNVAERRHEFALLAAVGYRPRQLRRLVLAEHGGLVAAGLGIGAIAAICAVLPALLGRSTGFPLLQTLVLLAALTAIAAAGCIIATRLALHGDPTRPLREE